MGDFMAKMKSAKLSMNNKEKAFVYEIIGIISLLVSIIALARFGLIGKYLVLAFSLLFGDWYFIFIILVGVFGVYCLLFHKKIEIKSIRYYGIILILLSLLVITHFGMHDYVSQFEGNALKITLNLYFDYFKSNSTTMIKGGGIIGCIFFYVFYLLLGKIGTAIISLLIFFIGIVFLMKKTIREFIEMIVSLFKKSISFFKKRYTNIIESVKEISNDYLTKNPKEKKTKIKFVKKEKTEDETLLLKTCEEYLSIFTNAFKHLDINVKNITYLICEHILVYFVDTDIEVNYKVLEYALRNKIDESFMIKYDKINNQVIIEVNKKEPKFLSFQKAIKEVSKNELSYIIGIDDRNVILELDKNMLIISDNQTLLQKYLLSIYTFASIQKKHQSESFVIIDINKKLSGYNVPTISDIDYLNNIIEEIDQNLELLNLHHKMNVDEYNMFYKQKILKKYYFIYGIEDIIYKQGYFDKLLYIVQTGKIAGINMILTLSENASVSSVLLNSIDIKLMLKNNFDVSSKYIDLSYLELLSDVEGFYKDKDLIIRISLLMMKEEEFIKHNLLKEKT